MLSASFHTFIRNEITSILYHSILYTKYRPRETHQCFYTLEIFTESISTQKR